MAVYIVRSQRVSGFPEGTVLDANELPAGTLAEALVSGGHLEPYGEEGDE